MSIYRKWNSETVKPASYKKYRIRYDRLLLIFLVICAPVFLYFFSPFFNEKSAIAEAQSSAEFRSMQKQAKNSEPQSERDRWFVQYPTNALTVVEISFESYVDIDGKSIVTTAPEAALRIRYDRAILFFGMLVIFYLVFIILMLSDDEVKNSEKREIEKSDALTPVEAPRSDSAKSNNVEKGGEEVKSPSRSFEDDVLISLKRADNFFTRSTLLLAGGIIMAFIGVGIFYITLPETQKDETLTSYWPKAIRPVGVLIFLESIAWFLLRQYRTLVEDYKWFYRVYLKRANYLTAIRLLTKENVRPEDMFVAASLMRYDVSGHLKAGETTEWLEATKTPEGNMFSEVLKTMALIPEKVGLKKPSAGETEDK